MKRGIWNFAFIFGLVFTIVGIIMLLNQLRLNYQCTERTTGVIDKGNILGGEASVMLNFKVNGEQYRMPFGYSNVVYESMTVTVAYDPANINRHSCYILEDAPNTIKVGFACAVGGVIFMIVGYGVSIGLFSEEWHI